MLLFIDMENIYMLKNSVFRGGVKWLIYSRYGMPHRIGAPAALHTSGSCSYFEYGKEKG